MLSSIVWNANPEMLRIGSFAIRWYGLLFAAGFVYSYLMLSRFFGKEGIPISELDSLTVYMVLGTVIGARLGHCLFYEPSYYLSHPGEILCVWKGGLASHGAAIGIILMIWHYAKKYKRPWLWTMDRMVIGTAIAAFFIRTGNLINSEIYGHVTDLPWGMIFVRNGETLAKHPTQIYEGLWYLMTFFVLHRMYTIKAGRTRNGLIFGVFLFMVFGFRFIVEFLKEPQVEFEEQMLLNMGQLLSIPFVLFGAWLVYRAMKKGEYKSSLSLVEASAPKGRKAR